MGSCSEGFGKVSDIDSTSPIRFVERSDPFGIELIDPIERRRCFIHTEIKKSVEKVSKELFQYPVDSAIKIWTDQLVLPNPESVFVHDDSGAIVAQTTFDDAVSCPQNIYSIEITTSMKLYLRTFGCVKITNSYELTSIEFDDVIPVLIGVRSFHRQPSHVINTTDDIDDLRIALSTLSCSLKTLKPERSFPTLRGHPPEINIGEELQIPEGLKPADPSITLEIRPTLKDLLVISPLAFYLGANIEWGDRRIKTEKGFSYSLGGLEDFQSHVGQTLQQIFFMDCIIRTEGLYQVSLSERDLFEERVSDFPDFEDLYNQSPQKRLETYLKISYETVDDLVPAWSGTAYVEEKINQISNLPFLIDNLTEIRTTDHNSVSEIQANNSPKTSDDFYSVNKDNGRYSTILWLGAGYLIGGINSMGVGFHNRLERTTNEGSIKILVVSNDSRMESEIEKVEKVYTHREGIPFNVTVKTNLSVDELRRSLLEDNDLFHYIGHVDDNGFACTDGSLDADKMKTIGADTFLLNSCTSYQQGQALIENGCTAGIVTIINILNHRAASIGRTLAQFLHHGFPIYAAKQAIREIYNFGDAYTILGDGHVSLTQPKTTPPEYLTIDKVKDGKLKVSHHTYPSMAAGLGTTICPPYTNGSRRFLLGGKINTVQLNKDQFDQKLSLEIPILRDGELHSDLSNK